MLFLIIWSLLNPCISSGSCLTVKDPTLSIAVESCLRSFMKAFCCDNYKDEAVLQELMCRYYARDHRPQIIVSPFSDKPYNLHGRWAPQLETYTPHWQSFRAVTSPAAGQKDISIKDSSHLAQSLFTFLSARLRASFTYRLNSKSMVTDFL